MKFNPEDGQNFGPHCRNCHRGASGCQWCHDENGVTPSGEKTTNYEEFVARTTTMTEADAINNSKKLSWYKATESYSVDRYVEWPTDWDTTDAAVSYDCADNGFYWPHRTMGYMMLKDELFGLDFDGTPVAVGATRTAVPTWTTGFERSWTTLTTTPTFWGQPAHDLDSVCLDCHNPNIWNASSYADHTDDSSDPNDNYDDELVLRGLP